VTPESSFSAKRVTVSAAATPSAVPISASRTPCPTTRATGYDSSTISKSASKDSPQSRRFGIMAAAYTCEAAKLSIESGARRPRGRARTCIPNAA
jgi:hypothetical protein